MTHTLANQRWRNPRPHRPGGSSGLGLPVQDQARMYMRAYTAWPKPTKPNLSWLLKHMGLSWTLAPHRVRYRVGLGRYRVG